MLWNRRHVAAFGAVFTVAFILLALQLRSPSSVTNLVYTPGKTRTSGLHLLIPAGNAHVQLCRAIVSCLALGYPVPIISGWALPGELDAHVTHLAKVRNIMRYLDNLPSSADDDLMLIIDGYDIFMQLPADVMIKRYFEVVNAANARLEKRLGKVYEQSLGGGLNATPRQTILFGPDKICWPVDYRRTACWAVPDSNLPHGLFGEEDGDMSRNQPRWLNSGTIMGPIGDLRLMIAATLERMRTTYDPEYDNRESDQMYMSDLFGDQEYYRSVQLLKEENAVGQSSVDPIPKGGPNDKFLPKLAARQKTEYRIAIEYESSLFQTRAGNEVVLEFLPYNGSSYSTPIYDRPGLGSFDLSLPKDTVSSLTKLLTSISSMQVLSHKPAELVGRLLLGTNVATRQVFALYHCTGGKEYLHELWPTMWFFPYVKSLLKASVVNGVAGNPISEDLIDGRLWRAAHSYPANTPSESPGFDEAGAWADVSDGWLGWNDVCKEFEDALFVEGWKEPEEKPEEEKKPEEKSKEEKKPEEKPKDEKKPEEKPKDEKKSKDEKSKDEKTPA